FQISGGSWDPGTSDIVLRGVDGQTGVRTECYTAATPGNRRPNCFPATATPEPVTMTLLATGLAGLGGAGFMRRKKAQEL
ncbi:MAG: PEP-CTERM sorting domain-containing protein, partial [Gemmatimonadales bacterium]